MDARVLEQIGVSSQTNVKEGQVSWLYSAGKRCFDIFVSVSAMILLLPVYLIIAFMIKKEDGGPVIYSQDRLGQNGQLIKIYKFRSMKKNADSLCDMLSAEELEEYQKEYKLINDPRITKVGKLIRKTSIDELPQFLNVLKGQMSLVGPRPVVPEEIQEYGRDQMKFLSVKPGLTGYWQAYARNDVSYETGERQKMELYYIDHQSAWFDLKICIKTVEAVIKKTGV